MSELKPFPGPYRATKAGATIYDGDNHPIAHIHAGAGRIATARLFEQSPELLAGLRGLCFDVRQLMAALPSDQYSEICGRLLGRVKGAEALMSEVEEKTNADTF